MADRGAESFLYMRPVGAYTKDNMAVKQRETKRDSRILFVETKNGRVKRMGGGKGGIELR
jgi:hypothetical protein